MSDPITPGGIRAHRREGPAYACSRRLEEPLCLTAACLGDCCQCHCWLPGLRLYEPARREEPAQALPLASPL